MFRCNSQRNQENRQNKTFKDLWRLWEDHEWRFKRLRKTLQMDELCSQVPIDLIWKQTPKKTENFFFRHEAAHLGAPSMVHADMLLEHASCAPSMHFLHTHAPQAWKKKQARNDFWYCQWKAWFLIQTSGETFPINAKSIIHNFSLITKRFKRRQVLGASRQESLFVLRVSRVCFIYFVICL